MSETRQITLIKVEINMASVLLVLDGTDINIYIIKYIPCSNITCAIINTGSFTKCLFHLNNDAIKRN